MQTFLPHESFERSAAALDRRRLGKQRVEAYQVWRTLTGASSGWANHPAAEMWRGYEDALVAYAHAICREWIGRGYRDTVAGKLPPEPASYVRPPWLGDPAFHASHRSNLLRKDPAWYGRLGWEEPVDLPYVWPARAR